ncbi:MAG: FAD-dependent oxidoreductase [Chitinophagales bacterium]
MRIGIIGAGWFGCHIAYVLKQKGHHIKLFEKNDRIFSSASGNNTGRLHRGFHYPRCQETMNQTKLGFLEFEKRYKDFLYKVDKNIYGVSKDGSYMSWDSYKNVLKKSGLQFVEKSPDELGLRNLSGALICDEYFIDFSKSINFFNERIRDEITFNHKVKSISEKGNVISIDNKYDFDYVIDCTYGAFTQMIGFEVQYELVQLPIFIDTTKKQNISYVIMDGEFQTLSPLKTNNKSNVFSLYDVKYSRLHISDNFKEIQNEFSKINSTGKDFKVENSSEIIDKAEYYNPGFSEKFRLENAVLCTRAIINDLNANRTCKIEYDGKLIKVFSGKINTIFEAENRLLDFLS